MNKITKDIIALSMINGFGPRKIMSILGTEGDIDKHIREIRESKQYIEELSFMERNAIKAVSCRDENYPDILKNIYDPPPVLFYKGSFAGKDPNSIAIVGSRRCSLYGMHMAEKLAYDLALKGITIVSGMARGIDSAAHRGALKAGGRTVAVMGTGFKNIYPSENEKMISDIVERGAVITEFHSNILPSKGTFPKRNRIISGMVKGVIVVEAALKSGALITADFALEHGREVFAVPGRADNGTSRGTNKLIQNGAKLVMDADDVLEEISLCSGLQGADSRLKTQDARERGKSENDMFDDRGLSENELQLLKVLKCEEPVHRDIICELMDIENGRISEVLLKMEMKGLIKLLAGNRYLLAHKRENIYAS